MSVDAIGSVTTAAASEIYAEQVAARLAAARETQAKEAVEADQKVREDDAATLAQLDAEKAATEAAERAHALAAARQGHLDIKV